MEAPEDNENHSEPSVESALCQLLDDETLSDVTLEGTDGVKVFAIRSMLAVKSRVFRRMLFGEFSESESPIVKIGYTGKVLNFIVKYCVTDAARYFELPNLMRTLLDEALECTNTLPQLVCSFLQASRDDIFGFEDIEEKSLELIRNDPNTTLLEAKATLSIKATLLEEILKDTTLQTDEYTLFCIVKTWAEAEIKFHTEAGEEESKNRKEVASRLVKNYISLDLIAPTKLCNIIGHSGLIEASELNAAFKVQALRAEVFTKTDYTRTSHLNRAQWKSSNNQVLATFPQKFCVKILEPWVSEDGTQD